MPVFEYVCRACGKPFEKLVTGRVRDVACPSCASPAVEKQLSAFAVPKAGTAARPACGAAGCGCEHGGCGEGLCGGD